MGIELSLEGMHDGLRGEDEKMPSRGGGYSRGLRRSW